MVKLIQPDGGTEDGGECGQGGTVTMSMSTFSEKNVFDFFLVLLIFFLFLMSDSPLVIFSAFPSTRLD